MPGKKLIFFLLIFLINSAAFGQESNDTIAIQAETSVIKTETPAFQTETSGKFTIRRILNRLSFNLTTGYGRSFYSHRLQNNYLVTNNPFDTISGLFLLSSRPPINSGPNFMMPAVKNWLNNPSTYIIPYDSGKTTSRSDTSVLKYRGNSFSIPLTLQVHYEFLDRFRAGAGVTLEYHRLPVLTPSRDRDIIGDYVPDKRGTLFTRYFIMAGARIYRRWDWSYFVDAEIGKLNMGSAFNKAQITKGFYFNLGVPMEFEISEYLHAVVRPSFEYKRYTLTTGLGYSVNHQFPAIYLNLGFKYNIPEIPRCPIHSNDAPGIQAPPYPKIYTNKHCRNQKKHFHGDKQYRGQPFYKKQNPDIGENQPVPVRYKLFNKRKISGGY